MFWDNRTNVLIISQILDVQYMYAIFMPVGLSSVWIEHNELQIYNRNSDILA